MTRPLEYRGETRCRLYLSGASRGNIRGLAISNQFTRHLSGASHLGGELNAGKANFELSGVSSLELSESANDLELDMSGAGSVDPAGFTVNSAGVKLSSASTAAVNAPEKPDIKLSSASRLYCLKRPATHSINVSASSTVAKR